MQGFMTLVSSMIGIWIALKLLPPLLDAIRLGIQQNQTNELIKQHPDHANEIRKAAQMTQIEWQPPAAAKKGSGPGKLVVVVLCLGYIAFPFDAIPDVIPILGWGDDLVAAIIGLKALFK